MAPAALRALSALFGLAPSLVRAKRRNDGNRLRDGRNQKYFRERGLSRL
jgi:hypothetical protein